MHFLHVNFEKMQKTTPLLTEKMKSGEVQISEILSISEIFS